MCCTRGRGSGSWDVEGWGCGVACLGGFWEGFYVGLFIGVGSGWILDII